MLPFLEGRWTNDNCSIRYTEYRFVGAGKRELVFNWGPQNSDRKLGVEVLYDREGNLVLHFPALNHRTTVRWLSKDLRETTDVDKDGIASKGTYRRCSN